jgi:hypothetical protein
MKQTLGVVETVLHNLFLFLRFDGGTKMGKAVRVNLTLMTVLFALAGVKARAQSDEDFQSWNDLQLTVPMTKHVDFTTKVTMRFGKNATRLTDGRYQFGFVWKPVKDLSISPFYWYIDARNSRGLFRTEHRLNLAVSYRFPIRSFGLTHRSTFERRLRQPVNTWRYRAALTFEKEIPKNIIPKAKFFFGDEVFYDSGTKKFSRNRFSIGINKTISKQLSVDIYYMRQNDGFTHPGDLNVIWTAWRLKF